MDARKSRLVSLFDLGGWVGTSSSGMLVRELGQRSGDGEDVPEWRRIPGGS